MIQRDDVELSLGVFVGRLHYSRDPNRAKLCDVCDTEPAMWVHLMKKGKASPEGQKQAYLCFGCGGH